MSPNLPNPALPANCATYESVVQRVLDRELGFEALDAPHAAACKSCRQLAASARLLAIGVERIRTAPPDAGLAERIVKASVRDRRAQERQRWATRAAFVALAASVLIAVFVYGPSLLESRRDVVVNVPAPRTIPKRVETPPERVTDRVSDAGSALASITRKATDQTLTPTRNLLPQPERVALPESNLPGTVEPAADTLATMPSSAKSGLEPMTNGARRAVNLFLRDTGFASSKPKS